MTLNHRNLHRKMLDFREAYREMELELIRLLQETERTKLHRAMGCSSVFNYAVDILTFSESVAYTYISVARAALEFPALIESGLSVWKASRIVSALSQENAAELIEFALNNTSKKIDREVARRNPKTGRERFKPLADEFFEMKFAASKEFPEKLERVNSLQAQRGLDAGAGAAVEAGLDEYLRRHDPVQKAERAKHRTATQSRTDDGESKTLCLNRVRRPLTAEQRHSVHVRDRGRCAHVDANGKRCGADRWVDIHHIIKVSRGGGNEPENLTTLCSFHHDLVHRVTWLKSPYARYG